MISQYLILSHFDKCSCKGTIISTVKNKISGVKHSNISSQTSVRNIDIILVQGTMFQTIILIINALSYKFLRSAISFIRMKFICQLWQSIIYIKRYVICVFDTFLLFRRVWNLSQEDGLKVRNPLLLATWDQPNLEVWDIENSSYTGIVSCRFFYSFRYPRPPRHTLHALINDFWKNQFVAW